MKLSILIPSIKERNNSLRLLLNELSKQYIGKDVEILTEIDNKEITIGAKRNLLLLKATGEYICFIDDDDMISKDYISKILLALQNNPDCCSLMGVITWDNLNPELFEHSIRYKEYKTTDNPIRYERYPNHLNVIKKSIAIQFKFPEINHGEDSDWAMQIYKSGLLKKETTIENILYHYQYKSNK